MVPEAVGSKPDELDVVVGEDDADGDDDGDGNEATFGGNNL